MFLNLSGNSVFERYYSASDLILLRMLVFLIVFLFVCLFPLELFGRTQYSFILEGIEKTRYVYNIPFWITRFSPSHCLWVILLFFVNCRQQIHNFCPDSDYNWLPHPIQEKIISVPFCLVSSNYMNKMNSLIFVHFLYLYKSWFYLWQKIIF